jgi:hypothetical protein
VRRPEPALPEQALYVGVALICPGECPACVFATVKTQFGLRDADQRTAQLDVRADQIEALSLGLVM